MSYVLKQEINIASGSASAMPGNLSMMVQVSKGLTYAAIAYKQQVNIVGWDARMEGMTQDVVQVKDQSVTVTATAGSKSLTVLQAKFVPIANRAHPVLVVCTPTCAIVYEWNGSSVLYTHPLAAHKEGATSAYTLGIASIADTACFGTSNGEVCVFSVKSNSVKQKLTLTEHKCGIVDIASNGRDFVCSASHDGLVVTMDASFKPRNKISTGQCICCLGMFRESVLCGTVFGLVLIYEAKSGEMLVEIAAHARSVNSIDVASDNGLFLTASEDSFVRVWKIQAEGKTEVQFLQSESVKNAPLVGGHFVDQKAESFAVTGYDYPIIYYFKYKSLAKTAN